jgi:hypothetical protein
LPKYEIYDDFGGGIKSDEDIESVTTPESRGNSAARGQNAEKFFNGMKNTGRRILLAAD